MPYDPKRFKKHQDKILSEARYPKVIQTLDDPYKSIAARTIEEAYKHIRMARSRKIPETKLFATIDVMAKMRGFRNVEAECEAFFKSEWFEELCDFVDVCPDNIRNKI